MAQHIICPDCGSKHITMTRDSRGLPEARCADCGRFIKKMGASEVADLFEELEASAPSEKPKNSMPCKYCSERFVMEQGSRQTAIRRVPLENDYCPMCGRKLTEEDKRFRNRL